ncbi:zinc metalloprotease [Botrytis cinerea]
MEAEAMAGGPPGRNYLMTKNDVIKRAVELIWYSSRKELLSFGKPNSFIKMPSQTQKTYFRTVQNFKTDYAPTNITQYVSERTGMNVVVVDQKGPQVNGYFALATEIFDDSGSPHTLEHLCFMGSKSYQYKGLLDKLATRAYSNTNAWTATDHTAYTLETAGWEGFSQILPVYLEHLILPTLTEEGCYTEVHHVDGEGNDAGVVYSEMQGIQNTGSDIMDLRARQLLYPENIGFRYETGERIRAFHKEMYQPKNLCLVLIGEIDQKELLEILDNFEEGILDDIPSPTAPFKRPWVDSAQPPPLTKTIVETVHFPEEDESMGEIWVGMFGPDCKDAVETGALNVLLAYLAGSSVSILENIMVEKEELASSISYWWDARPNSVIWFQPTGVETEKLAFVEKRLFELLREALEKPLDMAYMKNCLERERRQCNFEAESSQRFYAEAIINDFLFGNRDGSTLKDLKSHAEFDTLDKWSEQQWKDFLKKWIVDAPHVSLLGTPSEEMSKRIKKEEEARVAERKEKLGPEGLEKLAEKLKAAVAKNDAEIPASLLQKFSVPGTDSIHFHKSTTARSGLAKKLGAPTNEIQKVIDSQASESQLFLQFEHVPTNFVHLSMHFGTSEIPLEHRPLLSLFIDNFFDTPILRDGKRVEFEQVVTELEHDTIRYEMRGGSSLGDAEGLMIQFRVEREKYETAIEWIRTMMFDSIFDATRLSTAVTKILADIPDNKRDGNGMLYTADGMLHMSNESSMKARTTLVKSVYMKRLKKLLKKEPETVIGWLESLRKSIFKFNNIRALVVADINRLPAQCKLGIHSSPLSINLRPKQISFLSANNTHFFPTMDKILVKQELSSSNAYNSYTDPQLPALRVALSFLRAVEGPLWTAIRGTGLGYGSSFHNDLDTGFVQFSVYRSPDAFRAFAAGKKILEEYISGEKKLEDSALEAAISDIVVEVVNTQITMDQAGQDKFVKGVMKGLPENHNEELLRKVRDVGREEIRDVMKEVLLKAFEPGMSNVMVTCAPIMEEAIVKNFQSLNFKTQVRTLASFEDDYGLAAPEDDEDGDEDEDEDEDMDDEESGSDSNDEEDEEEHEDGEESDVEMKN